jgi:hypothetical protein
VLVSGFPIVCGFGLCFCGFFDVRGTFTIALIAIAVTTVGVATFFRPIARSLSVAVTCDFRRWRICLRNCFFLLVAIALSALWLIGRWSLENGS